MEPPAQIPRAASSTAVAGSCCSSNQETLAYAWGADGRLANFSTTGYYPGQTPSQVTNTESAHWDGDDLLDVALGSVVNDGVTLTGLEIYIEKLGWMTQGLEDVNGTVKTVWATTVYDRDQTGTAVNMHGATTGATYSFFSQLQLDNIHPYNYLKQCSTSTGTCTLQQVPIAAPNGGASCAIPPINAYTCTTGGGGDGAVSPLLSATREDGYYDGTISIQGVRAYDPNMNQWTTPDAYSGDVHDPMSQHPYMWNGNNPVQYGDPSGFDRIYMYARQALEGLPFAHLYIVVKSDDDKTILGTYSFGPSDDKDPNGSTLVQKHYKEDSPSGQAGYGNGTLIGTTETGFNETGLAVTADEINKAGTSYDYAGNNSNSAAYTMCSHNGGAGCGTTDTGGHPAPGDGRDVLNARDPFSSGGVPNELGKHIHWTDNKARFYDPEQT